MSGASRVGTAPSSIDVSLAPASRGVLVAVAAGAVLVLAGALLWWRASLDAALLLDLNGLRGNSTLIEVGRFFTHFGMPLELLVLVGCLVAAMRSPALRATAPVFLVTLMLFAVAGVGGDLLKEVFGRPRPFVTLADRLVSFSQSGTPAFPSGHATKSVALAVPFVVLVGSWDRWRLLAKGALVALAIAVCASRVVLGAHYVSDVLAGAGLALCCTPLALLLARRILHRATARNLDVAMRVWAALLLALALWIALAT